MMQIQRKISGIAIAALFILTGCDDTPQIYPVTGKVVLTGRDAKQLAGHYVEIVSETDSDVRASGPIDAEGGFTLETLHAGVILKGVREGKYQVRILKGDEDNEGKKLRKPPIAARFFQFQTSGLSIVVPTTGEVTLELAQR
jgi:hypothetical protein